MKQIKFARTGYILIAYGIIKITGYLSKDLFCLAFQYDFACGILLIVLGILVLTTNRKFKGYLLSAALGAALIVTGTQVVAGCSLLAEGLCGTT